MVYTCHARWRNRLFDVMMCGKESHTRLDRHELRTGRIPISPFVCRRLPSYRMPPGNDPSGQNHPLSNLASILSNPAQYRAHLERRYCERDLALTRWARSQLRGRVGTIQDESEVQTTLCSLPPPFLSSPHVLIFQYYRAISRFDGQESLEVARKFRRLLFPCPPFW